MYVCVYTKATKSLSASQPVLCELCMSVDAWIRTCKAGLAQVLIGLVKHIPRSDFEMSPNPIIPWHYSKAQSPQWATCLVPPVQKLRGEVKLWCKSSSGTLIMSDVAGVVWSFGNLHLLRFKDHYFSLRNRVMPCPVLWTWTWHTHVKVTLFHRMFLLYRVKF